MKGEWGHFRRVAVAIFGLPVELLHRAMGLHWHLTSAAKFTHPAEGWSITAPEGMPYDSFTFAPNLRLLSGGWSKAAAIHDKGWEDGVKDDGSVLTFDENNFAFRAILIQEGHSKAVVKTYAWGVSLKRLRKRWRHDHGHE